MSASGARLGRNGALLATAVMAVVACRGQQAARANPNESPLPPFARPNVLLITIDALRADHLGTYGYRRGTSPHIDAFAHSAVVFEQAYTYWPKTRGSFAMMLTGRTPARNGYSARHPGIADFNPTLASVLQAAGYRTVAAVDNPNVAKVHGYAKGFDSYRSSSSPRTTARAWVSTTTTSPTARTSSTRA